MFDEKYVIIDHIRKRPVPKIDDKGMPIVRMVPKKGKDGRTRYVPTPVTEQKQVVIHQVVSKAREQRRALMREYGVTSGRQWNRLRKLLRRLEENV